MKNTSLTVAQALVIFLDKQYVRRDGVEHKFFEGCFGIFGHGNVAGLGQALNQYKEFRYIPARNEQGMVHAAVAFARVRNRLSAYACTSSIGPGATNMITGAALATINRLPVLLLPGDIFATRVANPVLQQLESTGTQEISVNDCFKPVSKYWDRINRPEQLVPAMMEAMRVLTSPSDTGAVTISLPQDVQVEAFDFPEYFFDKRIWDIPRNRPDKELLEVAMNWIQKCKRPLIIAGGGVMYSEATDVLKDFINETEIPVAETMSGKGALPHDHASNLGAIGVTGTPGAVQIAQTADLIIGIGTRYSDFTTSSNTLFKNPNVRFININVSELDVHKKGALTLVGDARATLRELTAQLSDYKMSPAYYQEARKFHLKWKETVSEIYSPKSGTMTQGEIIGAVDEASGPDDILVCASGSLPGDLHKVWRARGPLNFHMEYGYSCMGYEIAGGLGARMASEKGEVYVMLGDGSYLMMAQEILTARQEGQKLIIVLINNYGFKSIGSLSRSIGEKGFGTRLFRRDEQGVIADDRHMAREDHLAIDYMKNAESMGLKVFKALTTKDLREALANAKAEKTGCLIYTECDRYQEIESYSWWDVPVAEVAKSGSTKKIRKDYDANKKSQNHYL